MALRSIARQAPPVLQPAMGALPQLTRRLKLRHVAFLLLLLSGAIPLAITNWLLIAQNRELLVTEEKSYLTTSAQALSRELDDYLAGARRELEQMGAGTLAPPGSARSRSGCASPG